AVVARPVLAFSRCDTNHAPLFIERLYPTVNPPETYRFVKRFVVVDSVRNPTGSLLGHDKPDFLSPVVIDRKPFSHRFLSSKETSRCSSSWGSCFVEHLTRLPHPGSGFSK